jgi:hypothetical protein
VERYSSPFLFHGPSARAAALALVPKIGRLLRDMGEDGLKIDDTRELADLLANTPVGDVPGVIVVGPMCRVQQGTADVLLKSLEEFDQTRVRPILWAFAEADVSPTVRSRCLLRWCAGEETIATEIASAARKAVKASIAGDVALVIEAVKGHDVEQLLAGAAMVLEDLGIDAQSERLWLSLRETISFRNVSAVEALAAFLPEPA